MGILAGAFRAKGANAKPAISEKTKRLERLALLDFSELCRGEFKTKKLFACVDQNSSVFQWKERHSLPGAERGRFKGKLLMNIILNKMQGPATHKPNPVFRITGEAMNE